MNSIAWPKIEAIIPINLWALRLHGASWLVNTMVDGCRYARRRVCPDPTEGGWVGRGALGWTPFQISPTVLLRIKTT